jgi:hypothetical protein
MKHLLLASAFSALAFAGMSQVTSISVETFAGPTAPSMPAGMTTYRIYANLTNANDFVSAITGDYAHPLNISSTGTIHQNANGGNFATSINQALFAFFPALQYDSWLTIGKLPYTGIPPAPYFTVGLEAALASFNAGGPIAINSFSGGGWFALFPEPDAYAGADLKVLLGQVTTDGVLYGKMNIQVFVNGVQTNGQLVEEMPFSSNPNAVFGCTQQGADNFDPLADTDDGSCVFPCALALTASSITPVSCFGSTNGAVSIVQSGAQEGVLFGINLAANANPSLALGNFNNLPSGTHTVIAVDGAGCSDTIQFQVPTPTVISLSAILGSPITCNGDNDAVINATASGGTGAFTYAIADSVNSGPQASGSFANLGAGLYTVTATDANGCQKSAPAIQVLNPGPLTLGFLNSSPASCFNSADAVVVVQPIGGSGQPGSMQYSTNGVTFAPDSVPGNNGILYLAPGTYTIYVQDVNGCIGQTSTPIVVSGPPAVVLNASAQAVLCAGDQNGSISVLATGGTGAFSYVFEGGESGDVTFFGDLSAGTYTVSATDTSGCTATSDIVVAAASPVLVSATATPITCNGDGNGIVGATASGGTGAFLYSIDNVSFGAGSTFGNLLPGIYTVYVEDENGCTSSSMAQVTEPAPLVLAGVVTDDNGTGNGAIDITVAGGTTAYSFSWTGPNGFTATTQSIANIDGGTYTLTVTDANGCTNSETFDVVTGVEELVAGLDLAVFPNPTNGLFTVALQGLTGEILAWDLRDVTGRTVASEVLGSRTGEVRIPFDVTGAASGVYLLNVQSGATRNTVRVLVQQ